MAKAIDVPVTGFIGHAQIELSENREAIIEGCRSILNYDENLIKLDLGEIQVSFSGKNLIVSRMNAENAVIEGEIEQISFSR